MQIVMKYIIVVGIILAAVFLLNRVVPSFTVRTEGGPIREAQESRDTVVELHTSEGVITLELFHKDASKTVQNFIQLTQAGFYDGTKFHRVVKDFMIQGGDPLSKDDDWSDDGRGGPGYMFEDEINEHKIVRGAVAMANSGPNTNGSQFFIVTVREAPWLDGKHTVFGRAQNGMEVVDTIENVETDENDHPREDVVVERITVK